MAIKVGDTAPDFTLFDTERKPRSLKEFAGKKTVLAFYPGAFTGVCTKEMCAFRDAMAVLGSLNAQIIGISIDSPFANKAFAEANKITYPLLSDFSRATATTYVGLYDGFGGVTGYTAAKRGVVVLDAKGKVTYTWTTDNPAVEPPYEEVQKALAAI